MPSDLLFLMLGGFLAALAAGLAGFAFALVASAVWYHLLPPQEAAPLVVAGGLAIQMLTLVPLRRIIAWRMLVPFLIGGALGVPLGTLVLLWVDARLLTLGVGLLMILYGGWMLLRMALQRAPLAVTTGGRRADAAVGLLGGVLGGIGGFSGVLPTLWCDLRGWPKDTARGVYQPYIVAMHACSAASLAAAGFFSTGTMRLLLPLAPALLLGTALGLWLYKAATAERFRLVLLVLVMVSGLSLVW
jgi:uncharacterized membrane protein YfcA